MPEFMPNNSEKALKTKRDACIFFKNSYNIIESYLRLI